ncbi:MAG: bifunctional riboflavin kinase/FAD synthetase [Candidatus Cohnella colombiensis]|uniref:Riboflavin biosynthesis protein n=1 Tax=Candidatus Cohnella colombiensis TaxID=3121368 RepID=A0AA95EZ27_9BACL|nr:MAG: bifunctional riboflavin kinase/FAD synthetase [Cohnella sp.]
MERYDVVASHIGDPQQLPEGACKTQGISLAIGFFDGVHLGHLEVVRQAVAHARMHNQIAAVMTFDPHPRAVLGSEQFNSHTTVLTPLEDKLALLAQLGVEAAYVIHFDQAFSQVTAEQFVRQFIMPIGVNTAIVGFDFKFGFKGQGNPQSFHLFSDGQIQVQVVSPVFHDGAKVSSSRIRDRLADGDCADATKLLDRPYQIKGEVIHGDARGRLLGFPTANVQLDQSYVIPRFGVYAIEVDVPDADEKGSSTAYKAVLNVGVRPTFDNPDGQLRLEAHLFDFDGDLYGKQITLLFHRYLRPERKFNAIDELVAQITADAMQAREWLTEQLK